MNSRRAFIVKVETNSLNCDPRQPLAFSDPSRAVNCLAESPEVFTVIMECGVLGNLSHFRDKKAFFGQLLVWVERNWTFSLIIWHLTKSGRDTLPDFFCVCLYHDTRYAFQKIPERLRTPELIVAVRYSPLVGSMVLLAGSFQNSLEDGFADRV